MGDVAEVALDVVVKISNAASWSFMFWHLFIRVEFSDCLNLLQNVWLCFINRLDLFLSSVDKFLWYGFLNLMRLNSICSVDIFSILFYALLLNLGRSQLEFKNSAINCSNVVTKQTSNDNFSDWALSCCHIEGMSMFCVFFYVHSSPSSQSQETPLLTDTLKNIVHASLVQFSYKVYFVLFH